MTSSEASVRSPAVLRALYGTLAPVYDALIPMISSKARVLGQNWLDVQNGETVLDLGTGTGLSLVSLVRENPNGWTEGLDATPAMLSRARNRLASLPHHQYSLRIGRATVLPYPENHFDAVHSSYLIDVLPSTAVPTVLTEISRVLRPQGRLVLAYVAPPTTLAERMLAHVARSLPWVLGGARPVDPRPALRKTGFRIQAHATRQQLGLRSAVVRATLRDLVEDS